MALDTEGLHGCTSMPGQLGKLGADLGDLGIVLATYHATDREHLFEIANLDAEAREVLRLEIVEGVPHQQIATLWGVHRTTVVRRIQDAREAVARAVRRNLGA